jgi:hypothetical protein
MPNILECPTFGRMAFGRFYNIRNSGGRHLGIRHFAIVTKINSPELQISPKNDNIQGGAVLRQLTDTLLCMYGMRHALLQQIMDHVTHVLPSSAKLS